jgi:predicted nuclease of predicted toxin-antitoxin system
VIGLLADANIDGHVIRIVRRMRSAGWEFYWRELGLRYVTFAEVGLDRESTDVEIWDLCQAEGLILITNNRNRDGEDSLEHAIRTRNNSNSLPVFTLGSADRVLEARSTSIAS